VVHLAAYGVVHEEEAVDLLLDPGRGL
jgi:hypothetical protein